MAEGLGCRVGWEGNYGAFRDFGVLGCMENWEVWIRGQCLSGSENLKPKTLPQKRFELSDSRQNFVGLQGLSALQHVFSLLSSFSTIITTNFSFVSMVI